MEEGLSILKNEITEGDKHIIDEQINHFIARSKNNRYEINKLVFESVSALTSSENYSTELESQGTLKRLLGSLSGKNIKIQGRINNNLVQSQYAAQQMLQKLAEQNLMSFELITAVNNKLNSSVIAIESEINNIYITLIKFFKSSKSNLIQLENRIERLERNVNLLNWQNSIEYQMFDGIEYVDLDDISKIVCLIRDFYDITKGKWTTSDLLLLKTAIATIGLSQKDEIYYKNFLNKVTSDTKLVGKLFEGISLDGMEKYQEYIGISAGFQKNELLKTSERYIVDSNIQIMKKYGFEISFEEVSYKILEAYQKDKGQFNLSSQVNIYDFILEMLYNFKQIEAIKEREKIKYIEELDTKLQEAEMLFSIYDVDRLIPLLEELIEHGYPKAKYMMALLYETGCNGLGKDSETCEKLLEESINQGYIPALIRRTIPLIKNSDNDRKKEVRENIDKLLNMANEGDIFAAEEYARCAVNFEWLEYGNNDYRIAIEMYNKAPYVLGNFGIGRRYDQGKGVEKDYSKSFVYYMVSAKYGYNISEYEIGLCYEEGYGCYIDKKKSFEYYTLAAEHGNSEALNKLAGIS